MSIIRWHPGGEQRLLRQHMELNIYETLECSWTCSDFCQVYEMNFLLFFVLLNCKVITEFVIISLIVMSRFVQLDCKVDLNIYRSLMCHSDFSLLSVFQLVSE